MNDETVRRALFEPQLQAIGDIAGGAGKARTWARGLQGHLAQG